MAEARFELMKFYSRANVVNHSTILSKLLRVNRKKKKKTEAREITIQKISISSTHKMAQLCSNKTLLKKLNFIYKQKQWARLFFGARISTQSSSQAGDFKRFSRL